MKNKHKERRTPTGMVAFAVFILIVLVAVISVLFVVAFFYLSP